MYYILTFKSLESDDTVQIIVKNDNIITILDAYDMDRQNLGYVKK